MRDEVAVGRKAVSVADSAKADMLEDGVASTNLDNDGFEELLFSLMDGTLEIGDALNIKLGIIYDWTIMTGCPGKF